MGCDILHLLLITTRALILSVRAGEMQPELLNRESSTTALDRSIHEHRKSRVDGPSCDWVVTDDL